MNPQHVTNLVKVINAHARETKISLSRKMVNALATGLIAAQTGILSDIRMALQAIHAADPEGEVPAKISRKNNGKWTYQEDGRTYLFGVSDDDVRAHLQYLLYRNYFTIPQVRAIAHAASEIRKGQQKKPAKVK